MCRAGGAVCARVWRLAGEPILWRGAGFADVLCARANGAAVIAGRLPGLEPADWFGKSEDVSAHGNVRSGFGGWTREGNCGPRFGDRESFFAFRGCGGVGDGRLRECFL